MSKELDYNKVLHLVKQKDSKDFILICMWAVLKSLKKNCQAKKNFVVHWQLKKITDKQHELVVQVYDKLGGKTMKDYHNLYLKCKASLFEWTKFKQGCNA